MPAHAFQLQHYPVHVFMVLPDPLKVRCKTISLKLIQNCISEVFQAKLFGLQKMCWVVACGNKKFKAGATLNQNLIKTQLLKLFPQELNSKLQIVFNHQKC